MISFTSIANTLNPKNWISSTNTQPDAKKIEIGVKRAATGLAGLAVFANGIDNAKRINAPTKDDMQIMPIAKTTSQLAIGLIAMWTAVK